MSCPHNTVVTYFDRKTSHPSDWKCWQCKQQFLPIEFVIKELQRISEEVTYQRDSQGAVDKCVDFFQQLKTSDETKQIVA